jgi:hypothetical protein
VAPKKTSRKKLGTSSKVTQKSVIGNCYDIFIVLGLSSKFLCSFFKERSRHSLPGNLKLKLGSIVYKSAANLRAFQCLKTLTLWVNSGFSFKSGRKIKVHGYAASCIARQFKADISYKRTFYKLFVVIKRLIFMDKLT